MTNAALSKNFEFRENRMARLRAIPGILPCPPEPARYPFSWVARGLPRVGVCAITGWPGSGKTESVLKFLSENQPSAVAWVESQFTFYPGVFEGWDLAPNSFLFLEAGDHALWAAQNILRSQIFPVLVLNMPRIGEVDLRKLQIFSEKSRALVIAVLEPGAIPQGRWPLAMQIQAKRVGESVCLEVTA